MRLVVLLSGTGTIFEAIVTAIEEKRVDANLIAVISDNPDAYGLTRAREHQIETIVINAKQYADKKAFQLELKNTLLKLNPDLIALSGFMRILSVDIIRAFPKRIINIHPALLPKYPGLHTHERVLQAGDTEHGTTVHFVDEGVDTGPIIAQRKLMVLPDDTPLSLQQRIKALEQKLYPEVLQWFAEGKIVCK